ncbi:PIR protein CIR protein [Plasmodium vinckei brucechwatti]|uniref:PIR protein CIR protein n=1 Tax=Plasmodium vinckei brucechwatti TaxID=119398 RepID=A0A6V7RUF8_PLAVN|nr:PIR protein CIR protein [Plasmodium vinckei brucechwatti]
MDDQVCDFLREVDENFNNGGVNVVKFNKFTKCHSYCPYENNSNKYKCTNNNDRINALSAYLYNKISEIDKTYKQKNGFSRHIEVFTMWLGEKLFRVDKDYKATLEESYKKNLEKFMGNVNYWKDIDSNKLYKMATIKRMSDYYRLLNYICKLIIEYNKNPKSPNRQVLGRYSSQCDNFYKTIHNSINGCGPYIYFLDSLKMIFEIFRVQKIVTNNNIKETEKKLLLNRVKSLETFQGENRYLLPVNVILSFDDKECVEVKSKDEQLGEQILKNKPKDNGLTKKPGTGPQKKSSPSTPQGKPAPAKPPLPRSPERPPANPSIPKPAPPKKEEPPKLLPPHTSGVKSTQQTQPSKKSETSHQSGAKGSDSKKGNKVDGSNVSGGAVSRPESSGGKPKDDGQKKPNQVSTPSPGPKAGSQPTGLNNQGSGVGGTQDNAKTGKGGGKDSSNTPVNKDSHSKQGDSSSGIGGGPGSVQGDQGKSPGKTNSGADGQGKSSNKTGSGPGGHVDKGSQGISVNQVNTGSQTKHSGDPVPTQTAPASSGTGTTSPGKTPSPGISQSPPDPKQLEPPPSVPSASPQQPDSSLPPSDPHQPGSPPAVPPQQPGSPSAVPPSQNDPSLQAPQTGGSSNQNGPKDSDNSKGNKNGANDNTGGSSSGSKDPGGGPSDPTSSTSGGSFDLGSSFHGFLLNGMDKFNKAYQFIEKSRQTFEDAKDKISGAYNSAVDNLKSAYNASNDYFNSVISNITSQLNQVDPPKSGGNHNGPGNPSGGGNPTNQLQSPQPPSTTDPTDPSNPPTPTKDPAPTTPPTTPIDPTSQKQSSPQHQPTTPQHITPNPPQVDPFIHKTPGKAIAQLVKSISSNLNLKKTWNIFPTTWNGSGDCKPEIKFMNTTLVCCTSEQCSLTGIPVILVLIPIILLIAYKYLSFGSSKKSEKKNIKRVINFHDGNRKTKIIISSNDRNKDLKPVINLVNGKKGPLLNIYKLIRADPMPFINLFFLLIFFVYKRKRDTIE